MKYRYFLGTALISFFLGYSASYIPQYHRIQVGECVRLAGNYRIERVSNILEDLLETEKINGTEARLRTYSLKEQKELIKIECAKDHVILEN